MIRRKYEVARYSCTRKTGVAVAARGNASPCSAALARTFGDWPSARPTATSIANRATTDCISPPAAPRRARPDSRATPDRGRPSSAAATASATPEASASGVTHELHAPAERAPIDDVHEQAARARCRSAWPRSRPRGPSRPVCVSSVALKPRRRETEGAQHAELARALELDRKQCAQDAEKRHDSREHSQHLGDLKRPIEHGERQLEQPRARAHARRRRRQAREPPPPPRRSPRSRQGADRSPLSASSRQSRR